VRRRARRDRPRRGPVREGAHQRGRGCGRRAARALARDRAFATELPEKINSFFWAREGKDTLALGNITGAMVFQSTLPLAFGMAFTDRHLGSYTVAAALLALAGAALAIFELVIRKRFLGRAVLTWALLYASFVIYVVATL